MALVARTAFGDLFLRDDTGSVFWLKVQVGQLAKVADSEQGFRELVGAGNKRDEWFAETDEQAAAGRGMVPRGFQCIGFKMPLIFAESSPNAPYLADLYEYVSFLGDLNRQISKLSDGSKVRLRVQPDSPLKS
jgi:hypothetical protein